MSRIQQFLLAQIDAEWAWNNLQAEVDFGYRATHVAALAGKYITTVFYGQKPKLSYFLGCSTGGRQGYVEAPRWCASPAKAASVCRPRRPTR